MKTPFKPIFPACINMLVLLLVMACAAGSISRKDSASNLSGRIQTRITPLVEDLHLNSKELTEIYRDVRSVARGHALRGNDNQLNHVQKIAFYVHKALSSASHQWEMLSIMEDIRSSAMADYFTLRHKGLERALREAVYDERFIKIYLGDIRHAEVKGMVNAAVALIGDNRRIFSQLMAAMAPMVHKNQGPDAL